MYPKLKQNIMESANKKSIVRDFGKYTNIEGINNAGRAPSTVRVTVWLTIFVLLGKSQTLVFPSR